MSHSGLCLDCSQHYLPVGHNTFSLGHSIVFWSKAPKSSTLRSQNSPGHVPRSSKTICRAPGSKFCPRVSVLALCFCDKHYDPYQCLHKAEVTVPSPILRQTQLGAPSELVLSVVRSVNFSGRALLKGMGDEPIKMFSRVGKCLIENCSRY